MKHQIATLIEETLLNRKNDVDKSFPSIFSREDVKHQLEEFGYGLITTIMEMAEEKKSSRSLSLEGVEKLSELLTSAINLKLGRLDSEELVDYNSAEFSMNYDNRVELDSVSCNVDFIADEVGIVLDGVLLDFFTPEEEENETPYATEQ
jgi:uncharacterized protein (DUF2164 family)